MLLHILSRDPDSIVRLHTAEEVYFYKDTIGSRYQHVPDIWAAMDGLKLLLQETGEDGKQKKCYNGWTHGHYINSVFVFSTDGKIRMILLNTSGTFHDSTMADCGIYEGMQKVYDGTGVNVVVDSVFNIESRDFLIKSSQQDPANSHELLVNRDATLVDR